MKYKRVLSLLLCLTIAIGCINWRPQKVDAIAVTTTTAVVASVAAIITACGVSYWANTQQDAINYLGGKIDEYLDSLSENTISYEEWLGISGVNALFTVIGNGVLSFGQSVANKILDFVRWFNQEESISSGGQPVGEFGAKALLYDLSSSGLYYVDNNIVKCLSSPPNQFRFTDISTDNLTGISSTWILSYNATTQSPYLVCQTAYLGNSMQFISSPSLQYIYFYTNSIPTVNSNVSILSSHSVYSNDIININKNYSYLWIHPYYYSTSSYKSISMSLSGTNKTPDKAVVTPSSSVSVPQDVSVGQTLDITTNAVISRGDTQDEACLAILDTVVSQDGLSSSSTTEGEAVPSAWTWLYNLVHGLPSTIAQAISNLFAPSGAYIQSFVDDLNSTFSGHFSILSYPFSILGEFITRATSASSQEPIFQWPNVYEPFSSRLLIAAGSYNLNRSLDNTTFANLYSIYLIVIKGYLSFSFLKFLYAWFCDVFKMRESDYDAPDLGGDSDDS